MSSSKFIQKMDSLARNQFLKRRVPKFIKRIRTGLFCLLNIFYKNFYFKYYKNEIEKMPKDCQLFFVGRNDFGTQLYLLNYVKLWEENRSSTCIVILTSDFDRIQRLASLITPKTVLIYPKTFFLTFPMMLFGSNLIHYSTLNKIYPHLAFSRPDGLNLFYLIGEGITEYNAFLDESLIKYSSLFSESFLEAYKLVRSQFDYRWNLFRDYFCLYASSKLKTRLCSSSIIKNLRINKPYVLMNVNCKDYKDVNSKRRGIHYPERYNSLIDLLVMRGYQVIIQGREEQPFFTARDGLIDYSKSEFVSIENDLFLYSNCEFVISSKSGVEIFASICDVPVLGLNYTEILGMQPAKKMRFYPKYLRHRSTGKILSWKEYLNSPCFFEIGEKNYSNNEYEYIDLSEEDMISALEEFLSLKDWAYTPRQKEFKRALNPLHLELFLVQGVPCDVYLKKTTG